MRRRSFMALSGACLVCGCSGAVHRLPQFTDADTRQAQVEILAARPPVAFDADKRDEAKALRILIRGLVGPAEQVCREMAVGECEWKFLMSPDREMNAAALPDGYIIINRGVVEYANNPEEVCLVIAHEIGHQAANHVAAGYRNQAIGAMIGAAIAGAATIAALPTGPIGVAAVQTVMQFGAGVGGEIGAISYSKEQEREADYLAALILYRASVDLDRARGMLVTMARLSRQMRTELLDTHPAGPERIAGWDRAVAEIRATNGRLPPRA